ncbi:MAG: hypothetical protein MK138_14215, partial [Planctomycetes bacterium]|nr:hypothetical protein [Planctomycetota bacterium]
MNEFPFYRFQVISAKEMVRMWLPDNGVIVARGATTSPTGSDRPSKRGLEAFRDSRHHHAS